MEWRPQPAPPPELASALGRWWSEGSEFVFRWRDGGLEARRAEAQDWAPWSRFEPLGDDRLRAVTGRERGELLRLVRDAGGAVTRMYWATYPFSRDPEITGTTTVGSGCGVGVREQAKYDRRLMSAPAPAAGRVLVIRGRPYPVLLPTPRDPRLHLAAVIVSLQVLGQVAFDFRLSIAQILVSLGTCAVLEVGIAFRRQQVIMWPASALLTGNGVAFVLRVPGTEHGDWWSLHGWWIFAGDGGRLAALEVRDPAPRPPPLQPVELRPRRSASSCSARAGPSRSTSGGGRCRRGWRSRSGSSSPAGSRSWRGFACSAIAVGFWLSFAAGLAVLAASGHAMTARWHLGPITGGYFWWVLVSSPEILVFLFFMITDPKTIPAGRRARLVYAVAIGLLAALLIAPQRTEFARRSPCSARSRSSAPRGRCSSAAAAPARPAAARGGGRRSSAPAALAAADPRGRRRSRPAPDATAS